MKINPKETVKKCCIYCIENTVNQKKYIGKTINLYNRLHQHLQSIRKNSKDANRHLKNAFNKYGEDVFIAYIIEELPVDEIQLRDRELYYIQHYNTTHRDYGYNLRLDSDTPNIVHAETRKLISDRVKGENNPNYNHKWTQEMKDKVSRKKKQQWLDGEFVFSDEHRKKISDSSKKLWLDLDKKAKMAKKVSVNKTLYNIHQYTKSGEFVKTWFTVMDIISENPNYKKHNIYAVCSGEKPSIYGFKWVKELITHPPVSE